MKHFRDPKVLALCLMLGMATMAHAQISVGGGGDPTATFLQRIVTWFVGAPGRTLVVIAAAVWCVKLMFSHDYRGAAGFAFGAIGLIFLQTMVSYWIG